MMTLPFTRLHTAPLLLLLALLALLAGAGPAPAAEMEDYKIWVQSEARDFYAGTFSGTCADPEKGSVTLARLDHAPEFAREGEFVSPVYKTDGPFDACFVSWRDTRAAGERVEVFVRVGDAAGTMGEWVPVAKESDRVFPADRRTIQYKVRLASASGRTSPEFRSIAFYFADLYDRMKTHTAIPVDYATTLAEPAIIEREAWGAAKPSAAYTPQSPKQIILHHSWLPNASQYTGAATIRGIQDYHMNDPKTGWIDIGYHFLIGPDGKIFRGRPETALGSHCVPNTDKIGICCIGDYDPGKDPLTPAMYESVKKLVPYLAAKYKISKSELYGHRDFSPKTCPGETVYVKIPDLKSFMSKVLGK